MRGVGEDETQYMATDGESKPWWPGDKLDGKVDEVARDSEPWGGGQHWAGRGPSVQRT